jgi:hypothetical protein
VEQLAALMGWRQSVIGQIQDIKDAFEAADGGPGAGELQVCVLLLLNRLLLLLNGGATMA